MKTQSIVSGMAAALLATGWGCSSIDHRLGVEPEDATSSFVATSDDAGDAEADGGDASRPWVNYCPSNECPAGWGKCRSDQFECEVDFSSDPQNCGKCGTVCPALGDSTTACVDGICRYQCTSGPLSTTGNHADCNGYVDDGCEVTLGSNENCRFCGDVCLPETPCIVDPDTNEGKCGCDPSLTLCGDRACVDLDTNVANCGACGNKCDVTNGGTAPPHAGYGCQAGTCGHLICENDWGNCDNDWSNGCETDLTIDGSCGKCGTQCSNGVHCAKDAFHRNVCGCSAGLTYCDGSCVDLVHDFYNCGVCDKRCGGGSTDCVDGTCVMACNAHRADCNGSVADSCETNIWSDPRNCGGCGIECPGSGQACVYGKCVVAPCDESESPPEAR